MAKKLIFIYASISMHRRRKGAAMELEPHLILRVLHRILVFYHRNIFLSVNLMGLCTVYKLSLTNTDVSAAKQL